MEATCLLDYRNQAGDLIAAFPTMEATGAGYDSLSRYYRLEYADYLDAPAWTPISTYPADGQTVEQPVSAGESTRVYRIDAWLE